MAYSYNDPTRIKILPIARITIVYVSGDGTDQVDFDLIETDATFRLSPFFRPTDRGAKLQRAVGYEMDITVLVPVNDYDEMRVPLDHLVTREIVSVHLWLEALDGQASGAQTVLSLDPGHTDVYDWSAEWFIEQAAVRPRLNVQCHGIFSIEALTIAGDAGGMFTQLEGW